MDKSKKNETQLRIYHAVKELLEEKSSQTISIQDICHHAGIGVGTFYHYYSSKDEAIFDIGNPIDEYFEIEVKPKLEGKDVWEQIRIFFSYQAQFMINFVLANEYQGTLKYAGKSWKHFYAKDRVTYQLLLEIVSHEELYPEWKKKYPVEKITEHLLYLTRGAVNNWLGCKCSYDLLTDIWTHVEMTF